MGVKGINLN